MVGNGVESGFIPGGEVPVTEEFAAVELIAESRRGWSRVYRCVYHSRRVVLKAIRPEFASNPIFTELQRKEYELARDLNHPCIVKTYSMEEVPGIGQSIVMEHIDGIPLDEFAAAHPDLSFRDVCSIVGGICSALDYIHARRIVHRDVKPSNILVGDDGKCVKLIDFGLGHNPEFRDYGYAAGTPGYTPAERATALSDIYSFGVTLRECFSGRWKSLDRAIKKATDSDPAKRPASGEALTKMLTAEAPGWSKRLVLPVIIAILCAGSVLFFMRRDVDEKHLPLQGMTPELPEPLHEAESEISMSGTATPAYPPGNISSTVATALPLEEVVYRMSQEAARKRFAGQLALWDTLSCSRSRQLALVGHWRWLAKKDVEKWLATKITPGSPYFATLLENAAAAIRKYGDEHSQEEYVHWVASEKRTMNIVPYEPVMVEYEISEGRVRRDSLMEDGQWTSRVFETKTVSDYQREAREQAGWFN